MHVEIYTVSYIKLVLTFPERHLRHLGWVQAHVLFLCMLVASTHLLGMHGPENMLKL